MVFLGAATNGTIDRAELWGVAGPTPGTHQIQVTVTNGGGQQIVVVTGAKSFTNVFQTAATGTLGTATGNTTTPSTAALTNSALDYVVDAAAFNGNNALTAAASQTNAFNVTSAAPAFSGAGSIKTGFNNTTMSWTAGAAQQWAIAAIPLRSANPQVSFDRASSTTFTSAAATFTGSWNHTTTTAANRYIVVGVSIDLSTRASTVTSAVYGTEGGGPNSAMTFLGAATNGTNVRSELWGLRAPASGTHQITVTISDPSTRNDTVVAGAQSFSNVEQTVSTGTVVTNTGNSTAPTVAVTNSAYDYVVDALAWNNNDVVTPGATQDSRYNIVATTLTNFTGAASGSRGYTNTNMSWSTTAGAPNSSLVAGALKHANVGLTKTASAPALKLGTT